MNEFRLSHSVWLYIGGGDEPDPGPGHWGGAEHEEDHRPHGQEPLGGPGEGSAPQAAAAAAACAATTRGQKRDRPVKPLGDTGALMRKVDRIGPPWQPLERQRKGNHQSRFVKKKRRKRVLLHKSVLKTININRFFAQNNWALLTHWLGFAFSIGPIWNNDVSGRRCRPSLFPNTLMKRYSLLQSAPFNINT